MPLFTLKAQHSEMAGAVGSAQGSVVTHPHQVQSKLLLSGFQQTCINVTGLLQALFLLSGKITCSMVLMISVVLMINSVPVV